MGCPPRPDRHLWTLGLGRVVNETGGDVGHMMSEFDEATQWARLGVLDTSRVCNCQCNDPQECLKVHLSVNVLS